MKSIVNFTACTALWKCVGCLPAMWRAISKHVLSKHIFMDLVNTKFHDDRCKIVAYVRFVPHVAGFFELKVNGSALRPIKFNIRNTQILHTRNAASKASRICCPHLKQSLMSWVL